MVFKMSQLEFFITFKVIDYASSFLRDTYRVLIILGLIRWVAVLRVWDVLLYEGNRSMLFRTALALLEMHGMSP